MLATEKNNLAPRGAADAYRIEPVMLAGPPLTTAATRIHRLDKLEPSSLDRELGSGQAGESAVDQAAACCAPSEIPATSSLRVQRRSA